MTTAYLELDTLKGVIFYASYVSKSK